MVKSHILYVGNQLAAKGYSPTSIDTLGIQLEEVVEVKKYSDKKNPIFRLFHMSYGLFANRNWTDKVLIDTYSSSAFYFALLVSQLARLMRIPYYPILRGGNLERRLKHYPRWSKLIFANAKLLVAPSGFMQELFSRYGYHNSVLIPNNINIKKYPFQERKNIRPKLLWVRSFASLYNPQLAINLVEKLKPTYPDMELCFVGPEKDGTMKACKEMVVYKGLEGNISFTGKLSKEDWINRSKDFDIFLSTTNIDNTPVSVMEAMALGMVVVSTNAGGVPHLIEDRITGYLYNIGSLEELEEIINNLLNGNLHSTSLAARKKAENWDWEVVKEKWKHTLKND